MSEAVGPAASEETLSPDLERTVDPGRRRRLDVTGDTVGGGPTGRRTVSLSR